MPSAVKNKPRHITPTESNIFADLGFAPEEALALKFKAKILASILAEVRRMKHTQSTLVQVLDEHQPVISNLLRGRISQMSIEKLLIYADRLGLALDIHKSRGRRRAA